MSEFRNIIIFICGRKFTGKTTLAQAIAKLMYKRRRVIIIAPEGGFSLPGAPKKIQFNSTVASTLKGRSLILEPEDDSDSKNLINFIWDVQENSTEPVWLIIDEIDLLLSWRQPFGTLLKVIRYGRHRKINLIGITQRPANVHNDLLAQADIRILFQTTEPNDLTYLRKFTSAEPDDLQALVQGQFIRK